MTIGEEIKRLHREGRLEYGDNVMTSLCISGHSMTNHVYVVGVGWFCEECLDALLAEDEEGEAE